MGSDASETNAQSTGIDINAKDGLIATGKADAALEFLHTEGVAVITEVNEKALVRKIDWMIMPLMWAAYNLQYLDKVLSEFTSPIFKSLACVLLV